MNRDAFRRPEARRSREEDWEEAAYICSAWYHLCGVSSTFHTSIYSYLLRYVYALQHGVAREGRVELEARGRCQVRHLLDRSSEHGGGGCSSPAAAHRFTFLLSSKTYNIATNLVEPICLLKPKAVIATWVSCTAYVLKLVQATSLPAPRPRAVARGMPRPQVHPTKFTCVQVREAAFALSIPIAILYTTKALVIRADGERGLPSSTSSRSNKKRGRHEPGSLHGHHDSFDAIGVHCALRGGHPHPPVAVRSACASVCS